MSHHPTRYWCAALSVFATAGVLSVAILTSSATPAASSAGSPAGFPAGSPAEVEPHGDANTTETADDVVFAVHGGAGTLRREDMTPELERAYRQGLRQALRTGYDVVDAGGSGTEAVAAAIRTMEDNPLFNAGKGAVFTTDGANELDASIMDGRTLDAGAVTGVQHVRNPIALAYELMTRSRHVLLAGEGAELYAAQRGLRLVTNDYFFTQRRWDSLQAAKDGDSDFSFGETNTVGAVARDSHGNLAAGTSTGGLTNKPVGRIGDSPIIGAGTYADNGTMAASATGTGELFMRQAVTHDISAAMEYGHRQVAHAANAAIDETERIGGADTGGVIALDHANRLAFVFNTSGMFRGYVTADGDIVVRIYADD